MGGIVLKEGGRKWGRLVHQGVTEGWEGGREGGKEGGKEGRRETTPYMMGDGGREDTLHDGGWEGGRGHPT